MLLAAATASLVALGIELYVFTVAYPLFALVGEREFPAIHSLHTERITYSVGPAILIGVAANGLLLAARPRSAPSWLPILAAIAGVAVLAITAFVQVPLHARLTSVGRDLETIARLNANEWMRALAMTVQAACNVAMLWLALRRI